MVNKGVSSCVDGRRDIGISGYQVFESAIYTTYKYIYFLLASNKSYNLDKKS
jgi:hypothetical protein